MYLVFITKSHNIIKGVKWYVVQLKYLQGIKNVSQYWGRGGTAPLALSGTDRDIKCMLLDLYRDNKGIFFTLYSMDPLVNVPVEQPYDTRLPRQTCKPWYLYNKTNVTREIVFIPLSKGVKHVNNCTLVIEKVKRLLKLNGLIPICAFITRQSLNTRSVLLGVSE